MIVSLFGHDVKLRETHCTKNSACNVYSVKEPYLNLYVRLRNSCNAKCAFCEFRGKEFKFDLYKFYYVLEELRKKVRINKVSFTGGEPTADLGLLIQAVQMTKRVDERIFAVVNTNGVHLPQLAGLGIDSIALSRHHYLDEINDRILGFAAPSAEMISSFADKEHLHLSCNLVKGYIDSPAEVMNYLEFCSRVGVDDVGLVSLMKVNDYCKEHHVDFADLDFSGYSSIIRNKTWNNGESCRCANYLYISEEAKLVRMYSRYYSQQDQVESQLVFDGDCLRNGFNGQIIT